MPLLELLNTTPFQDVVRQVRNTLIDIQKQIESTDNNTSPTITFEEAINALKPVTTQKEGNIETMIGNMLPHEDSNDHLKRAMDTINTPYLRKRRKIEEIKARTR